MPRTAPPTDASAPQRPARGPLGRVVAPAAALDAAAVLTFAAVGRRSHAEGLSAAGVAETAWPFLVGAAVGWGVGRVWRSPVAARRGAVVWVSAVAVGLGLRWLDRGAVPLSFAVVTTVVLGVLVVGWRAVARLVAARR